jgi:hypothetical protein
MEISLFLAQKKIRKLLACQTHASRGRMTHDACIMATPDLLPGVIQ